jgi:arylsulfatase A-like enzyme
VVDRWLGRILQKIDDLQLWDDSIVAITSDHGMSIGEHARTGKSNIHEADGRYWPIYPEIGHVPFLLAGGGVPQGVQLDLIAQPVDILPTLSDLAGVAVVPEQPFEGHSFAQAVLDGGGHGREYAVSGCHVRPENGLPPRRAVTPFLVTPHSGYAPVGSLGRCELYDLQADPLATTNLARDHPGVLVELHEMLVTHLHDHGAADEMQGLWHENTLGADGDWAIDYPEPEL